MEIEVTQDEARFLGQITGTEQVEPKVEVNKVEVTKADEPKPAEDAKVTEPAKKVEDVKPPEPTKGQKLVADTFITKKQAEIDAKAIEDAKSLQVDEKDKIIAQYRAKEAADKVIAEESKAIEQIKELFGEDFDKIESKMAELYESEHYEKLEKAGMTADQRMLVIANLSAQAIGLKQTAREEAKKQEELKNANLSIKGEKEIAGKSKDVRQTYLDAKKGSDSALSEFMGADKDMEFIFGKK